MTKENNNKKKSIKNLKPFNKMDKEKQRKIASQGGKAAAKKKAERRSFKECLDILLNKKVKDLDFKDSFKSSLVKIGADIENDQVDMAIAIAQVARALTGDPKSYEKIRDTLGEKPVEKIEVRSINTEVARKVEDLVKNELSSDLAVEK